MLLFLACLRANVFIYLSYLQNVFLCTLSDCVLSLLTYVLLVLDICKSIAFLGTKKTKRSEIPIAAKWATVPQRECNLLSRETALQWSRFFNLAAESLHYHSNASV